MFKSNPFIFMLMVFLECLHECVRLQNEWTRLAGGRRRVEKSMACQSRNTSACSLSATGWQLIVSQTHRRDWHDGILLSKRRAAWQKVIAIVMCYTCLCQRRVWQTESGRVRREVYRKRGSGTKRRACHDTEAWSDHRNGCEQAVEEVYESIKGL